MHPRTQELDKIMRAHDLTPRDVGEMLDRAPHTVQVWRSISDDRVIPVHTLEVLRMRVSQTRGY